MGLLHKRTLEILPREQLLEGPQKLGRGPECINQFVYFLACFLPFKVCISLEDSRWIKGISKRLNEDKACRKQCNKTGLNIFTEEKGY